MNKTQKIIVVAGLALAVVAVAAAKAKIGAVRAQEPAANTSIAAGPAVYLFLNGKENNCECAEIHALFDQEVKTLSKGILSHRIDINGGDKKLFEKYNVKLLPTILFVDAKGEVRERFEGEGKELMLKIKNSFRSATKILSGT